MDSYKLIEDTIKIDKINKDGKVFERGNYSVHKRDSSSLYYCLFLTYRISFKNLCNELCEQAGNRT